MPPSTSSYLERLVSPRRTLWLPPTLPSVGSTTSECASVSKEVLTAPTREADRAKRPLDFAPSPPRTAPKIRRDRLGEKVMSNVQLFNSVGGDWQRYVSSLRPRQHIHPQVHELPHPAGAYLKALREHGAPIRMTDRPWTPELRERVERGSHSSTREYVEFVRDEMAEFDDKAFWTVLPYDLVAPLLQDLRISPLGCVPQRDRRPRLINDLTFYEVNGSTLPTAPAESMQFGRTLDRLLFKIHRADPRHGPVYMIKVDISDGFYRVPLEVGKAPALAVILPRVEGEPPLVAIPLSLPMGWVESPPYFCTLTETVADIANAQKHRLAGPHRLEPEADTAPPPLPKASIPYLDGQAPYPFLPVVPKRRSPPVRASKPRPRLAYFDVYVDDFISLAQGSPKMRRNLRRVLFHTIDTVLAPLDPQLHPQHNEAISVKKLRKGDACWSTQKVVLGWLIDTIDKTIRLPDHRVDRLVDILQDLHGRKRVSVKKWHRTLGELRSMALGIPGGRGLFSTLQHGLSHSDRRRVKLTKAIHDALEDFSDLGIDLSVRPTKISEIVPSNPMCVGAHDASGVGAGGVWFSTDACYLWRHRFDPSISSRLVTFENPRGDLTNSDLEQAGGVLHHMALAHSVDVREQTIQSCCDNVAAVSRFTKGSLTSVKAPAYLCRLLSFHQRQHRDAVDPPASAIQRDFDRDLRLAMRAVNSTAASTSAPSVPNSWRVWTRFCDELQVDHSLRSEPDPVAYLLVFAVRYRSGQISKSGEAIRSGTVADVLRHVGQTMALLGGTDHRLLPSGKYTLRLERLLRSFSREDPAPSRVQPASLDLLAIIFTQVDSSFDQAVAQLCVIGFFYLCRPGEACAPASAAGYSAPFRLCDVTFHTRTTAYSAAVIPLASLHAVVSATLCFTEQKNGNRGDKVHHHLSGHAALCPVTAIAGRVQHLRLHNAPADTPLYVVFQGTKSYSIAARHLTAALQDAASIAAPRTGINPTCVTARSLRPGGATALLCADVDHDKIKLLGRWKSDAMLCYLHLQAAPSMRRFAPDMLQHGYFTFLTNDAVPQQAHGLLPADALAITHPEPLPCALAPGQLDAGIGGGGRIVKTFQPTSPAFAHNWKETRGRSM